MPQRTGFTIHVPDAVRAHFLILTISSTVHRQSTDNKTKIKISFIGDRIPFLFSFPDRRLQMIIGAIGL